MAIKFARAGLILALILGAAPVLKAADEKVEGDLKKMQGKWVVKAQDGDHTYTFEGKTLKVVAPSRTYVTTVKLDEKAKPEKILDVHIDEAPEDAKGKDSLGIYKFEGDDKLVWCFRPEGARPDKFEMIGFEQIIVEMNRAK
jgi:uncharacterized protein (TIGR03067 family)